MKAMSVLLLILCLVFSGQQTLAQNRSPHASQSSNLSKKTLISQFEKVIPQLMQQGDVPGLSIALIQDSEVVWHQSFGVKNADTKERVRDSTVYEAASLGKPVFAYAVLKLVDSGKLDLDKPLSKYLPETYLENDDRISLITTRMVLSHTTGFQNEVMPGNPLKLYFTPGEKFSYSGEGFLYLQKVIEHLTKEPLDAFMKRTVFDPLRMADTSYVWRDGYETLKASGHNAAGVVAERRRPLVARVSGLHTTTLDFAKFVIAVMKGTGLRKETTRQMLKTQVGVDEGCYSCIDRTGGRLSQTLSWGLGWGLERTEKGDAFWHWGENNGEFQNFIMAYPKQKTGIVIFTNSGNGFSITPEILTQTMGRTHPAFAWMGYELYNSPAKILFRDILSRGEAAIDEYRRSRKGQPGSGVLNETQMNALGYRLLGKRRNKEAIEVFKINVEDFPGSWNAYDSLGEAYMINGDQQLAINHYQKSLDLNPNNTNAVEMIKKLRKK